MTPGLAAEVAALNADFEHWHAFLSSRPPEDGPPRVWASMDLPTHPCAPGCTNPEHHPCKPHTGCGETLDADTPAQMRALLTARARS